MNRGDIYMVDFEPTKGYEQQRRPALVISSFKFYRATGTMIVVPIRSDGNFSRNLGISVEITGTKKITGRALSGQVRVLDIKAGAGQIVDKVDPSVVDHVAAQITAIINSQEIGK
ncbi:type II toxin-antitoxin system PemK/MazF family toxin [Phyllobacterium endophyticum]|uniref:type II toxin-antitoxin system PemK/MazF family toxin n=1 Tax=Phyllobacterium endophyticum TaxID=1149773 RepID=UPI0011C995CF|nr:type II toxin-antitoxin system PemK/MazF family toxin [Phyllobacterium endophyticum]TXR49853.1 type II toxin-antitoxin system PemK/MazF family toxin [Phyllobacterium endophyticum]